MWDSLRKEIGKLDIYRFGDFEALREFLDKKHLRPLSEWSKIEEFRETPAGERHFKTIMKTVSENMPEESVFWSKNDKDNEERMNQFTLRMISLLSGGRINNDKILTWVKEVNKER